MANMMKKMIKSDAANTEEAKTATAGLGIFGLAIGITVEIMGLTTRQRKVEFKSLKR